MSYLEKNSTDLGWRGNFAALFGIVLLGTLIYGHTTGVPWYMDDIRAIVENPSIQRQQNIFHYLFSSSRGIADVSFALNYSLGKTNVFGYHLVNIAIHLVTSCLVFLLFKRVFRNCFLLALGGALIFVAHPLQTQAVTYIVQRMTSLAALFFFLALYLYILAREASENEQFRHWLFYGGALVCGALAVLTKQNTAVLPVALMLFERYFMPAERRLDWKRLLYYVAPFALVPIWLAAKTLLAPMLAGSGIADVGGMPDLVHLRHSSPLNYLVTEFSAIWIYLRLLFVPWGQALDYDVPIVAHIWVWKNLIAFLGIAALLAAAAFLRKKLPYISAGIFWFFLCLSVESTFIPLDPVFEHRLYIPIFGFAVAVMAGFERLPRRSALAGIALMIATLSVLTWNRNDLWNDPVAFHKDNLRHAPRSERVHLGLANAYRTQGRLEEALPLYERALEINPDYVLIHINLSMVYAARREHQKAVDILMEGVRRNPSHFKLYNNLGVLYNYLGMFGEAAAYLEKGITLRPNDAMLHFNFGLACARLGRLDEAIRHYRRSIDLDYTDPESHFNLGLALYRKGSPREALQAFLTASRLNPGHAESLYNAGSIYLSLGDFAAVRGLAVQLQRVNPEMARQLQLRLAKKP